MERFQLTLCDSDTHYKRKSPPESRDTFSAATETELTEEKPHASLDPEPSEQPYWCLGRVRKDEGVINEKMTEYKDEMSMQTAEGSLYFVNLNILNI